MKLGIIGLPNVGKSTLFNALTGANAQSANYAFCTIEPNIGIVTVPDERTITLSKIYQSKRIIPATIEFVDIAGLVKGASQGEGLGNRFLSHIREVDALIHVVRCFDDQNIIHVDSTTDPKRDVDTINTELILTDIESLERRIDRMKKQLKGDNSLEKEINLLVEIKEIMETGVSARNIDIIKENPDLLIGAPLLSAKPVIYCANVSEELLAYPDEKNPYFVQLQEAVKGEESQIISVCAELEAQLAQLDSDEREQLLLELNIKEAGLNKLIRASYELLGLISYLTAGEQEVRAWTVKAGTKAPQAAGKIHSDFERGFIRAEVVTYRDLEELGSPLLAKEKGLVRSEGKDYIIKDGDVVLFRFNV